ncbi:MAG: hypothetical protein QG608_2846, partial [Actinomycetota bacterium]|nr:hypothetical protein [Actinomycetota bacterium]
RHLMLTHAEERSVRGSVRRADPSPFLAALGPDSCERLGRAVPRRRPKQSQLRLI